MSTRMLVLALATIAGSLPAVAESYSPYPAEQFPRQVYWGDTHLHTMLSPDASLFGNRQLSPDDAYRFAKGKVLTAHNGMKVQLRRPLDFLVVTDHAEYLGVLPGLAREDPLLLATEAGARWAKGLAGDAAIVFSEFWQSLIENTDMIDSRPFQESIWKQVVANAQRHNVPGQFTAFIGYEYTSTTNGFTNEEDRIVIEEHLGVDCRDRRVIEDDLGRDSS